MGSKPAIVLFGILLSLCIKEGSAAVFEFGTQVENVTVELSEGDDPNQAVTFVYEYLGLMPTEDPLAEIEYQIYQDGCDTLYADFTDTMATKAMVFNSTVEHTSTDQLTIYLSIDLETISDSVLWTDLNATHAELKFCGRLKIKYDSVFVNFHETDLTTLVNKVSNSTFESESVALDMVQSNEVGQTQEVALDYPVQVYHCDASAVELGTPPTELTQGNYVQLCVSLLNSVDGVYVDSIWSMSYWSELYPGVVSTIITDGSVNNAVTEMDCSQVAGVCRIKFIATGNIFHDDTQVSNSLVVDGQASIALGTDSRRRLVQLNGKRTIMHSRFHLNFRELYYEYLVASSSLSMAAYSAISLANILVGMVLCALMICLYHTYQKQRHGQHEAISYDHCYDDSTIYLQDGEIV